MKAELMVFLDRSFEVLNENRVPSSGRSLWYHLCLGRLMGNTWDKVSPSYLADVLGVSTRTVYRQLNRLQSLSLLRVSGTRESYNIRIQSRKLTPRKRNWRHQRRELAPPETPVSDGGCKLAPPETPVSDGGCKLAPPETPVSHHCSTLLSSSDWGEEDKKKKKKRVDNKGGTGGKSYWQNPVNRLRRNIEKVDGSCYWNDRKSAKWAKQFRLLHEEDGVSRKVIRQTLEWYCAERLKGTAGLPKCQHAINFRMHFAWITDKMREAMDSEHTTPPDPRWLEEAKEILETTELGDTRAKPDELARLLRAVWIWQERMIGDVQVLRARQTSINENGFEVTASEVDGVRPDVLWCVVDTQSEGVGLSALLVSYLTTRVLGYAHWNGNLEKFFPGGREFMEFIQRRSKDLNDCWLWSSELVLCYKESKKEE